MSASISCKGRLPRTASPSKGERAFINIAARKQIRAARLAVTVAFALAVLSWAMPVRATLPIPDAVYWGNVTINGGTATSGFVVNATSDASLLDSYTVGSGP